MKNLCGNNSRDSYSLGEGWYERLEHGAPDGGRLVVERKLREFERTQLRRRAHLYNDPKSTICVPREPLLLLLSLSRGARKRAATTTTPRASRELKRE